MPETPDRGNSGRKSIIMCTGQGGLMLYGVDCGKFSTYLLPYPYSIPVKSWIMVFPDSFSSYRRYQAPRLSSLCREGTVSTRLWVELEPI